MASAWGLLAGWISSLILFGFAGWTLYQRYERLQKRARDKERLAELGTLTGGLAHEIKNPLSTVQLNLQLLGEDVDPNWPGAQRVLNRLRTVQAETKRLRETLDDFLRYAGKLELEFSEIDLQS